MPPEELTARAERANDAGMVYFGKKQYADALVQYAEATEMAPDKVAYHGNTAAAASRPRAASSETGRRRKRKY